MRAATLKTQRSYPASDTLRVMRDIPLSELQGGTVENRRNCDGTLREGVNGSVQRDCTNDNCGGWGLEKHPLAMVYSPCQAWRGAYTPEVALERGTLFSELDLPLEAANRKRGCV